MRANINLIATNNITNTNSKLTSGKQINLVAANNITLTNSQSPLLSQTALLKTTNLINPNKKLFSITPGSIKDDAETQRAALAFNAGTDIQISSGNNINITNNQFNSGGNLYECWISREG